jgi:hypothetical protein
LTKTYFFLLRKLLAQLLRKGEVWRDEVKSHHVCFFVINETALKPIMALALIFTMPPKRF